MASPRKSDELPEVFKLARLRDLCREFITQNEIDCVDSAYYFTSERPADTFRFINSICNLIGYYDLEE